MNRFIPKDLSAELLHTIRMGPYKWAYDHEKHRVTILDEAGNDAVNFRLPIVLPRPDERSAPVFENVHYVILLIQSGSCAMGYFEDGFNLEHKVFRSYMVRKKQGKSQIKYLKTKGKSRAGSRVRLAETLEFFENINDLFHKDHPFQNHRQHQHNHFHLLLPVFLIYLLANHLLGPDVLIRKSTHLSAEIYARPSSPRK